MDIEFIPKLRGGEDRINAFHIIEARILESLEAKQKAKLDAMSIEELKENHYTANLPEIPKAKKDIDKAIDLFIEKMEPDKDNGEELLYYFYMWDIQEDIDNIELTESYYRAKEMKKNNYSEEAILSVINMEDKEDIKRARYFRERIKHKGKGQDTTILSSTKEVVDIVREYLQSLTADELYNLHIFGTVVSEEDANKQREFFIDHAQWVIEKIYYYVDAKFEDIKLSEEELLLKAGENIFLCYKSHYSPFRENNYYNSSKTDQENIKQFSELIKKAITEYPEETSAYYRANKMKRNNYSDEAILSTINEILINGTTTN
jgi:hypothetical protein